ncbi:MAG: four helix bundle protein [Aeromonadaceae bacterium]
MKDEFRHPKIYSDLVVFYKVYWQIHQGMPRPFRFTTGEQILSLLSQGLQMIVRVNLLDKQDKQQCANGQCILAELSAMLECCRGLLTLAWSLKMISDGALLQLNDRLDVLGRQAASWRQWFVRQRSSL